MIQLSPNSRHHILSFPLLLPPLCSPVLEPDLMMIIVKLKMLVPSNLNPLLLELDPLSQHLPLDNIWVVGAQESRLQLGNIRLDIQIFVSKY